MISRFERGLVPGMRVENVAAMLAAFRADDFIEHRMIKYVLDGPLGERLRAAGEIGPDGRRLRAAVADAVQ